MTILEKLRKLRETSKADVKLTVFDLADRKDELKKTINEMRVGDVVGGIATINTILQNGQVVYVKVTHLPQSLKIRRFWHYEIDAALDHALTQYGA